MNTLYTPSGQAREYAPLALNLYSGCTHGCMYCYAPSALQHDRCQFHANDKPRNGILRALELELNKCAPLPRAQVLLCFTCDPYQPSEKAHRITRQAIETLHRYGYGVQVLSKGGSLALRDLGIFTPADAYAATLTCLDPAASLKWEPGAALPADRCETLRQFHAAGIPTWASLEPILDPEAALEIIRRTHLFIDLYKIGRLNHHPHATMIDWSRFARAAVDLLDDLGARYYIKDSLLPYLPGFKRQDPDQFQPASTLPVIAPPTKTKQLSMF